jgi:uncharacterized protein (TIGR03000 family)
MFRNNVATFSLAALAAAVCLWTATPASAQHHSGGHGGGGFHGGGFNGGGFHGGSVRGGFNGGFHEGGFRGGFVNRGFYGGFYPWYGYGWGGYPGYYYGYSPYYYSYSTPYYYDYAPGYYTVPDAYTGVPPVVSTSAYPPSGDTQAHFQLTVPENAEVWFDDTKTTQTGSVRSYTTSNLTPGRDYVYDIRIRWPDASGQMMEKERKIPFHAGDSLSYDFTQSAM